MLGDAHRNEVHYQPNEQEPNWLFLAPEFVEVRTRRDRYLWKTKMRNHFANHMAIDYCYIEDKDNELARCLCNECCRDR